jgi:hypothetical protein
MQRADCRPHGCGFGEPAGFQGNFARHLYQVFQGMWG